MKLGVVVIDTLRNDVATEQMDAVWDSADHVFDNMYSTSRWTIAAHTSLFTGEYPIEAGTHSESRYLDFDGQTLAEKLSQSGFKTYMFSNNPYVDSFFNFDRGFNQSHQGPACRGRPDKSNSGFNWDHLFSELDSGARRYPQALKKILRSDAPTLPTLKSGVEMLFRPTLEEATFDTNDVDWLFEYFDDFSRQSSGDSFAYINVMPCHYPYDPPEDYQTVQPDNGFEPQKLAMDVDVPDETHERQWESYKSAAEYVDDNLERIITACDWDALFIISDHGELFGEHGLRLHNYGLYEELIHVPAVAIGNSVPDGVTKGPVSIVDIHETLLNLAGCSEEATRGINLFDDEEKRDFVYAESIGIENEYAPDEWNKPYFSVIKEDTKLLVDKDGKRCFDIESGASRPDEKDDLVSISEEIAADWDIETSDGREVEVSEAVQSRLEELGYK